MKRVQSRLVGILILGLAVGCGGHERPSAKGSGSTSGGATTTDRLPAPRADHVAIELPSGDIFVAGGVDVMGQPLASTVLVTSTGAVPGPDMNTPRTGATLAYDAANDSVYIIGGSDTNGALDSIDVFNVAAGTMAVGPTLTTARTGHATVVYPGASGVEVLIAGGRDAVGNVLDSAEVLDLAGGTSTATSGNMTAPQSGMSGFLLDTGNVLLLGGGGSSPAVAQLYDTSAGTFSAQTTAAQAMNAAVAPVGPSQVLIAGGTDASGMLDTTGIYNSTPGSGIPGPALAEARQDAVAARLSNGSIAVIAGQTANGPSFAVEVYTGAPASFVAAPDLLVARFGHTATALGGSDSVVVIGGRDSGGVPTDSIERIDLSAVVGAAPVPPVPPAPPGSITTYPYSENFDAGLGQWTDSTSDDFDWASNNAGTPSTGTGPNADHTSGSGNYLFTESSYPNDSGQVAILDGPTFASFQVLEMRFWYHMLGDTSGSLIMGSLSVDVSTDQGQTWTNDVWTRSGNQGNAWNLAIVDLSSYAGQNVTVRFRGVTASYRSDMAIDDVSFDDQLGPTPPPAPTPGGVVPFPYTENFDSGMGAWMQDSGDDFDWTLNSGGTPSLDTGPTADHTSGSGQYIYTESSYPNDSSKTAIINGPSFANFSTLELRFWYHMTDSGSATYAMGSADLEVSTDGGATWTSAWSRSGDQGSAWNEAIVDLSSYAGQTVQLRFRVLTASFNSDVSIDDVTVTGTP